MGHGAVNRTKGRLTARLRLSPTRYEAECLLAAGGMAEVFRGQAVFEDGTRHPVAIKRVLPSLAQQPLYQSMFRDEARLGMILRHPNVVRVHDARTVAGTFIMIMELVDGANLKALLEGVPTSSQGRNQALPVGVALMVARQVARGLAYAHAATAPQGGTPLRIIHRDVSPHNVLLSRHGEVKLTDFGLADANVHSRTQIEDGVAGGKLSYLAPEVVTQGEATQRIDVFGLGIVLWEMLAGQRLFSRGDDAGTVQAIARADVLPLPAGTSKEVDRFVNRLLAREPSHRPTAAQAAAELDWLAHRVAPGVDMRQVAELVQAHLGEGGSPEQAAGRAPARDGGIEALLTEELAQFALAAREQTAGAAPLDPDAFAGGALAEESGDEPWFPLGRRADSSQTDPRRATGRRRRPSERRRAR